MVTRWARWMHMQLQCVSSVSTLDTIWYLMMFCIVVDPSLHLSWIDGHWSEEHARTARDSIMRLVCLPWLKQCIFLPMYPTAAGEESSLYSMSTSRITCSPTTCCNLGCTNLWYSRYQLLPHHNLGVQTIEEEFNAYSTSHISHQGTNPLAFWNVHFLYLVTYF